MRQPNDLVLPEVETRSLLAAPYSPVYEGQTSLGGYAAMFGRPSKRLGGNTKFVEVVDPGAFRIPIERGDDVLALVDHDERRELGRRRAGSLTLAADRFGLRYTVDLDDRPLADEVRALAKAGELIGSSFRFVKRRDHWWLVDGVPHRKLLSVDLVDVSALTIEPAYDIDAPKVA